MIVNVSVTPFLYVVVARNASGTSKSCNFEDTQHYDGSSKNGNSTNGGSYDSLGGF